MTISALNRRKRARRYFQLAPKGDAAALSNEVVVTLRADTESLLFDQP